MFPDKYYEPCDDIDYDNVTFSEASDLFRRVENAPSVSEWQLLFDNKEDTDFYDVTELFF